MNKNCPNLSTIPGSLAHALETNKDTIYAMYEDSMVTLDHYKSYIRELIININDKPLNEKSPDTKTFLKRLTTSSTKLAVCYLAENTILAGDHMKTI